MRGSVKSHTLVDVDPNPDSEHTLMPLSASRTG